MYDTVNFVLFKDEYPEIDFLNTIPQFLTNVTVDGDSNQGRFVNGFLGTYMVSINSYRVKVHNSSLARFVNSNNQEGMSLQQTRKALEMMSDQLHLYMGDAKVTRIDIGRNIITKLSPETYIQYLGELRGYKRLESGDGVYYKNSLRELVFYNKIREQKHKRQEIQPLFKGNNLLRYELRLKNHLEKELNQPRVTAKLLYDEDFYINISKFWRDEYLKITKRSNKTCNISPTGSTRQLMTSIASISIQTIGEEALLKMVSEWHELGKLTKKQASDHRKAIRESVKKELKESGNEFIEELDKKIKQSVRFFN